MAASTSQTTKSSKGRQYRITLPHEKDDDIENVERGGPMLFSKYRAQNRETPGSSGILSISAASVQTGQNVLDDSQEAEEELDDNQSRPKKRRKIHTVTQKKWNWKDEYVEALIGYIKEYKTVCNFNGVDFRADLKELYTEVHCCLASRFPEDCGPDKVTEPSIIR